VVSPQGQAQHGTDHVKQESAVRTVIYIVCLRIENVGAWRTGGGQQLCLSHTTYVFHSPHRAITFSSRGACQQHGQVLPSASSCTKVALDTCAEAAAFVGGW
jgi:hypothetical protein